MQEPTRANWPTHVRMLPGGRMNDFGTIFTRVLSRFTSATGAATRSSVLAPMYLPLLIVAVVAAGASQLHAPPEVITVLVAAVGLLALAIVVGFLVCVFRNPDALRSEHFSLRKLAVERQLVGDDRSGLRDLLAESPERRTPQLGAGGREDEP